MKKALQYISIMALAAATSAVAASMPTPENPATGIWIQQVGDLVPHAGTKATLYYTKYAQSDRVKSISYQYNGAGYLLMKPSDKKTLCTGNPNNGFTGSWNGANDDGIYGADGIVHHPDGDLLVAGQGTNIYKVSKTAKASGGKCLVKTAGPYENTNGFWHLMMDPNQKWLWAAGIPGKLYRFSTETNPTAKNLADKGYNVTLRPNAANRRKDYELSTVIWDGDGTAFFTYSDYKGGGCEKSDGYGACTNKADILRNRASAYFGVFTDTTKTKVTKDNQKSLGGNIGDSVITSVGTKILIDSLEGAHGGTYDPYSKTIFVFGGAKIVQILPYREKGVVKAKVVASIDMREYFFEETKENLTAPRTNDNVGWRLDQGTVDGYGHLFVASNSGHMVFVDYASNPNKYINDNVLVHVQWVDNYLDDVAPLSGVGVIRDNADSGDETLSSDSRSSSSMVEYKESSSSAKSSSSVKVSSSSNKVTSSSSNGSSVVSSSSSLIEYIESSSSRGHSSSSNKGDVNSSSSNNGSSTNSSGNDSSNSSSSNSVIGGSSGIEGGNSSGADGDSDKSSSSNDSTGDSGNSSSSRVNGSGEDIGLSSSSSRMYYGAEDYEEDPGTGFDKYPTAESFAKGDSLVGGSLVVNPEKDPNKPGSVIINGNNYLLTNDPNGIDIDFRYDSGLDSAKVGSVVAITLDSNKVKEYFGNPDSLTFISSNGISLIDPSNADKVGIINVNTDGSVTIFVTADQAVQGGSIKVFGNGEMVIIDNINFYDPVPETRVGYIKDSDGNMDLDYLEILLKEPLSKNYEVDSVLLIVGKDTLATSKAELNKNGDRIMVDVLGKNLPEAGHLKDAKAIIIYKEINNGATYKRETQVLEMGSNVIKDAFAIRSEKGLDSLFIKFNIDLLPIDVGSPEMLVMLKQTADRYGISDVKKVYMPAKDIIILSGKGMKLKGDYKDSVSLYPDVTFNNLPYITSDEYDREVPVKVVERFPSAKNVEYWDTNSDGVLDQIVTVFDKKLTAKDLDSTLYMSFPWYSYRGMMIQLQAQPEDLRIDPKDSTRVIWDVRSPTKLASGVTSIADALPEANIFTYYGIFGETFVSEETAALVDRMPPMVSSATLSYGKKADTLLITFSEAIYASDLKGNDYFSYIHGGETIDLRPSRIDWSADGFSAKLVFNGSEGTILPGDSLVVHKGSKDAIRDNFGNLAGERPQAVIIGGLLNHLVESTQMGVFDVNDDRIVDEDSNKTYTLQTVSSVNLRYVPSNTTKEDMEKEGALGQLVQLGERFVPQLVDRAHVSADGTYDPSVLDSLKPEDVYISFIVNYFDHLGQYVNDTVITVPCNSPKFGGNCLETDKKVFVNWNFKDHKGRFVGAGVYNVQFKMVVRYENKKIEEEIKDKWGVRRKKRK